MNGDIPPPPAGYGPDTSAMPPPPVGYGPTQQVPAAPTRSLWTTGEWNPQAQQWQTTYEGPSKPDESGVAPTAPAQATGLSRLIPMVGEEFQQQYQPMAEELHRLNQAAGRGELWGQIKQDFPPTGSATDTLINAYGSLIPIALKRKPDGSIDWPGTMAASTGKAAALIGPAFIHMAPEERAQLPEQVKAAIPQILSDMRDTYQSAADSVRDFVAGHPTAVKGTATVAGGLAGAGVGAVAGGEVGLPRLGPLAGAKYGAKWARQAAQAAIDRATQSALSDLGYSDDVIDKMKPAEKQDIIKYRTPAPTETPATPAAAPIPATPAQAAPEPAAPSAAPTGDDIARQYGYKNEQEAIADVGRGAWQIAKAQGRAAGRPVGAPPPVAEPPAAARPAPAAAPESTLTQQLRASLAQEQPAPAPQLPEEHQPWGGQFAEGKPVVAAPEGVAPTPPESAAPTAPEVQSLRQSVNDFIESQIPFDQFPALNRRTTAQVGHALEQGDVAKAQQLFDDAVKGTNPSLPMTEEEAQAAAETDQYTREHPTKYFGKKMAVQQARVNASPELATNFRDAVQQFMDANAPSAPETWQDKFGAALRGELNTRFTPERAAQLAEELSDPSKLHAGADPFQVAKAALYDGGQIVERMQKAGKVLYDEFARQMVAKYGDMIEPHLDRIFTAVTESRDEADNISTRKPYGEKLVPSEDPYVNQLNASTHAIERDPVMAAKISDAVQGKYELTEPQPSKYSTPEKFQKAHDQWQQNMDNQYRGIKIDPEIADNPSAVFDSFKDQVKRNLIKLYNYIPESVRKLTAQWYDTARRDVVMEAQARGLENRQVAGVYASLSPQKDWFMNRSLAVRLMDIWRDQQDATLDGAMRDKLDDLTKGAKNADLKERIDSIVEGQKFSAMDTDQQAAFARLWDETQNDRSYNGQAPDGTDLGPVQKAGKIKGTTENADVAWGSLNEIGKAISILKDGSLENIQEQLLGTHKVPNFYNNILTPNHPGEYVTIDTHAVAAGLLRPLSGKSLEVAQNFGMGGSSAQAGMKGTYGLYADAYRDAASELGIQPRELQSITWEGIRDIFPSKWKTAENVVKINDIWRQFEQNELTHDQAFDKIIEARGGTPEWSAERRGPVIAEEDEPSGDTGELRGRSVSRPEETGRPYSGGRVNAPAGNPGLVEPSAQGATVPLRKARRAVLTSQ